MKYEEPSLAQLVDLAETLRIEGRLEDAVRTVKHSLEINPLYPRAILLLSRLLYQEGKVDAALSELRCLDAILAGDAGFKALTEGLSQISGAQKSPPEPSLATETMARLLMQQGYHLEALRIYRQLYLVSGRQVRFWNAIVELRDILQREGSRGTAREAVDEEVKALNQWITAERKGN